VKYLLLYISLAIMNISLPAFSVEIKSSIQLSPSTHDYREGDLVELDIKVWPIENAELDEFKKLEGTSLFGGLEITQLNSLETSENNADVVIIKATAMVSAQAKEASVINYKEHVINLSAPDYKFTPIKGKQVDFYVLDQSLAGSIVVVGIIVGISLIGGAVYIYYKKIKKPEDKGSKLKYFYQEMFSSADSRSDFENIYSLRKEWGPLLVAETNAHREFYKLMESHQYKKEWAADTTMEIKNSFDIIRGSFA
jgi:hypothetical protein